MEEHVTREECKELASGADLDEFYRAFKSSDGIQVSKKAFQKILEEFFYCTLDAFVRGSGPMDREQSFQAFSEWLEKNHPDIHPLRVFTAVDSVHAYT
jgi:hypothetical protein